MEIPPGFFLQKPFGSFAHTGMYVYLCKQVAKSGYSNKNDAND